MHVPIKKICLLVLFLTGTFTLQAQTYRIALLKYNGGGDWYANPSALPNLIKFCNNQLKTSIHPEPDVVEVSSPDIFNYPFVHMTGHGNVVFTQADLKNLRLYLMAGGFLHIDDNYGMDKFIRPELKRLFPELELTELPASHPIYHQKFDFKNGLPKIHEHDNKPPKGFGLTYQGRLVVFYTHETDLGDGWEDPDVHNDTEEKRRQALQMGANIIQFVLNGAM
ncbi:MAG: DUF4159 domain-containing protein [Bacteroidia bacterium]|nr:DUF4159 domain-containing protein [Bacteroidia bacterium]